MGRADTRVIGDGAEQQAFLYLTKQGLKPVVRNFRCRLGEIDLIMLDGDCLVFIEVRYRADSSYTCAALSVDSYKQRKLARTAEMFLTGRPRFSGHVTRFDVVGIDRAPGGRHSLEWLRDAFRP